MLRSVYIILVTICFDYYMAVVDEILLSLVSRIANSIHIADVGSVVEVYGDGALGISHSRNAGMEG